MTDWLFRHSVLGARTPRARSARDPRPPAANPPLSMSAASADARALQRASLADELEAECDRLRHERELLETHLARVSPPADAGASAEDASRSASDSAAAARASKPGGKKKARGSRSGAEAGSSDPPPRELSARERLDLANRELEILERDADASRRAGEAHLDELRARLENANQRVSDAKVAAFEFERDVAVGALDPRTNKVRAERFVAHVDRAARHRAAAAEQFRLKCASLTAANKKLEQKARAKEATGGALSAIDFERLKIEHASSLERLEDRARDAADAKQSLSRASLALAEVRARLADHGATSAWLHDEMATKKTMIDSFDVVMAQVREEHFAARKRNKDLHTAGSSSEFPLVAEYVAAKNQAVDAETRAREWEKKLEAVEAQIERAARGTGRGALRGGGRS